jgi:hypothetical protein
LAPFRIYSIILGDIRKTRCTTGVNNTAGKFATAGKITAGIKDTGGKFATGINDTGAKFPLVLLTPVANCHRYQQHRRQICHRCR